MSFPNAADQLLWPQRFLASIWDFSLKFEDVVLDVLPAAFWTISTPFIHYYYFNKPVHIRRSPLLWLKLILSALLLCSEVAIAAVRCAIPDYRTDVTAAAAALDIASALSIVTVVYTEHRRGIRASALLSLYLTLGIIIDGTKVRSYFIRSISSLAVLAATASSLRFVLLCVQEIPKTNLLIDSEVRDASGREATSGFWSRTFFVFMVPIFRAGFRRIISIDDLGNLGIEFSSTHLFASLSQRWNQATKKQPRALFLACLRTWKAPLLAIAVPRLCSTGFVFAQPFVLRHMVLAHRQKAEDQAEGGLVAATLLSYTGAAIAKAASMHLQYRLLTRIRGGIVSQLLDKTHRLKLAQAKKQAALTLMSTDLDGIVTGLPSCIEIPFAMLETGLGMFFLVEFVEKATFIVFLPLIVATGMGILYGKYLTPALRHWNTTIETRVAKTSRVLSQISGIKMLGLAPKVAEYLQFLRIMEIKSSRKYRYIQAASISTAGFLDMSTPVIVFAGALFWNIFSPQISTEVVFPALGLISLVQSPIAMLLKAYPSTMAMLGCFKRIQDYLNQEEHEDQRVVLNQTQGHWLMESGEKRLSTRAVQWNPSRVIYFENVAIAAIGMTEPILANLTLSVPRGSVSVLLGPTGAGKTTIFDNILGEGEVLGGVVYVDDMSFALCGQKLWLPNGTIRECIIGAFEYDAAWFLIVITACELVFDINQFEEGDQYLIGSGGVRLSGGQRQRVSIARATYARAATILFDDSFSALDLRTARAILSNLCNRENGLLRQSNSTVLMTTYLPESLEIADELLLLEADGNLSQMPIGEVDDNSRAIAEALLREANRDVDKKDAPLPAWDSDMETNSEQESRALTSPQPTTTQPERTEETLDPNSRQKGDSKLYWLWIDLVGRRRLACWLVVVMAMCFAEGFPTVYIKWWIELSPSNKIWFIGYALLASTAGLLGGPCVILIMVKLSPRASIGLHGLLTDVVMRCTLGFLGATDTGSILNRYSVDMDLIAKHIPAGVYNNLYIGTTTLFQVGIALSGANYMATMLPVLVGVLYFVQRYYLRTSRQLRHLDIESQAPLATAFRETADGLVYIRAFKWEAHAMSRGLKFLNESQKPFYLLFCAQQFLSLILDSLSSSLATVLALLTLYIKDSSTENSSGLSFLVLIILGTSFNRTIMTWTALETALGSLSRLQMFLDDTPVESTTDDARPLPDNWPSRGEVQISNVTARYVCDTEKQRRSPVLRDVTLSVEAGQKVGITGRTGSGKSSLLMMLLGFLEYEGSIFIDGIDLRTVSREELRSRIITISQDQVELDGTIRDNLLPFDKTWGVDDDGATSEDASDQAGEKHRRSVHDGVLQDTLIQLGIWQSLDHENPLDMLLSAAGFSHGETQLMCIARAVIRRRVHGGSLVLVDEATGGLDGWRDQAVREMMREYFHGCTIIIVAHRAESIADTQMHVRMTDGRIVERKNLSSMI
ncbi:uncharacterized protein LMH87_008960 [Akanthomyces muscarius]|uniref:ABC transporter n=1 Tax=Akanthomyces muscarius TaxID=2231603 RepID=A0A9W8QJQ3_AKAMU|nr:uncharacterized protein LMH87_008960 [Akanthomyces muscarius]KAJ4158434.1 hypothetical protein LMH87_008960 [Akanthomyces muscarius]